MSGVLRSSQKKQIEPPIISKGVAHIVCLRISKKKQETSQVGVLSTMNFLVLWSVWSGTDSAVRKKQNPVFDQKQVRDDNTRQNHHITPKVTL